MAAQDDLTLRVFYLWDFGTTSKRDPGFSQNVRWDVDLLSGYESEWVRNISPKPGTHHFLGLINPGLIAALNRFSPDAVLAFGYSQLSLLDLAFRKRWPLLLRGDSNALSGLDINRGLKAWLRRRILRRAAAHLAVGTANRQWLLLQGVSADRIFVAPHAIERRRFLDDSADTRKRRPARRHELGVTASDVVFLFVGKLIEVKDPLLLIRAFRQLDLSNIKLWIVGSGALHADALSEAADDARITFHQFVNQRDIPSLYALADVLVLPSHSETWGLVVNEAQTVGLASIVSDQVGCHLDLVIPDHTGWVFRAGDQAALKASMHAAATDPARLKRMQSAAATLSEQFDYRETTNGLREALTQLRGKA